MPWWIRVEAALWRQSSCWMEWGRYHATALQQLIDILPSSDCNTSTNAADFHGLENEEEYELDNILDVVYDDSED